ncbi:hypothetical protein GCM10025734_47730 [Kitasatospora paranensis]
MAVAGGAGDAPGLDAARAPAAQGLVEQREHAECGEFRECLGGRQAGGALAEELAVGVVGVPELVERSVGDGDRGGEAVEHGPEVVEVVDLAVVERTGCGGRVPRSGEGDGLGGGRGRGGAPRGSGEPGTPAHEVQRRPLPRSWGSWGGDSGGGSGRGLGWGRASAGPADGRSVILTDCHMMYPGQHRP